MYHYIYRLDHIETGEFYIGSRSSKVHPSIDPYLGSMKTWNPDKTKLKKIIIQDDFEDRAKASLQEIELIKININDPLNRNYNVTAGIFTKTNVVVVKDSNNKLYTVSKNDPKYLSGELVSIHKGKVPVKDFNNNFFSVSKNDPKYLSGELVHVSKNIVIVKDCNNIIYSISKNDPKYISGELVGIFKGKSHSTNTKQQMKNTRAANKSGVGERNSQFGKCWIHNNEKSISIKKEQLEIYLNDGWLLGRKLKFLNK